MKKAIIVSVVLLSTVVASFCVNTSVTKTDVSAFKVNKADFAAKTLVAAKSDLATAD